MPTDPRGPLAGLRILDASRVLAGPLCGQHLGDLGAEVIKIEHPGNPDETRTWGTQAADELSVYYLACNRNKRAITIDLAKEEGLHVFYELARKSDVVLHNLRAGSADRLGLAPEKLHQVNPRLVICSITGFGSSGPMSHLPGYDFVVQALSGLMANTGPVEGPPFKVGVAVADVLTGLHAAIGILACLQARERSGHGYVIDIALLDCAVASQVNVLQAYLASGKPPPRQGNAHLQIVPYQLFATSDAWLVVAVGNDGHWKRFCDALGRTEWADDARFRTNEARVRHRSDLVPLLEALLKTQTTRRWQEILGRADVPHAPVWSYDELFANPQAEARGFVVQVRDPDGRPVNLIGTPFHISGATLPAPTCPPKLGQDTNEVLGQILGLDRDRLAALRRAGVI
jgi:crotonobetainyl-CoA:carnitine CoA-transferase CaiB-like acyl-CoA transferase